MPFQGDAFHGPTFDEWKAQLERVSGGPLTEVHSVMALALLRTWRYKWKGCRIHLFYVS